MMPTIGIIEDVPMMRLGLYLYLQTAYGQSKIIDAQNLMQAQSAWRGMTVDIILLGGSSSSVSRSVEMIAVLRSACPKAMIVVYEEDITRALTLVYKRTEVEGIMLTRDISEYVGECLKSILSGKKYFSPGIMDHLIQSMTTLPRFSKQHKLTRREKQIAHYLASGIRTSVIATMLSRKPSTISTIKSSILRKMGIENVSQLTSIHLKSQIDSSAVE